MVLAHVVVPASSTSGRTGEGVVDGVFETHRTAVLQTLVGDDVVAEDVEILLYHRSEVLAESLHVLDEVGVDIVLESADAVVALDESASRGLLHDVEQVLTVSHAVEEGRQRAQVLGAGAEEEQVVVDALQLVHDGADVVDAVAQFHAHGLLDHADEGVAVHHGAEVVEAVGEAERLRIGHALGHLLHAAVDIAEVGIDVLDGLTADDGLQSEHTVGGRVVRSEVHHEVVLVHQRAARGHEFAVAVKVPLRRPVLCRLVGLGEAVGLRAHVEVLAERPALEVVAHEEAAHVGVAEKLDAEEVIDLSLQQVGSVPQLQHRGNHVVLADLLGDDLCGTTGVALRIFENIDTTQPLLAEVLADDGDKIVEMLLFVQLLHLAGEVVECEFNIFQFHLTVSLGCITPPAPSSGRSPVARP